MTSANDSLHEARASSGTSFSSQIARCGIANESDFTIFIYVRRRGFQPSLFTTNFFYKGEVYAAAGLCKGDGCSFGERTLDAGAECAGLGDTIDASADPS
jgi:hypothetical protein